MKSKPKDLYIFCSLVTLLYQSSDKSVSDIFGSERQTVNSFTIILSGLKMLKRSSKNTRKTIYWQKEDKMFDSLLTTTLSRVRDSIRSRRDRITWRRYHEKIVRRLMKSESGTFLIRETDEVGYFLRSRTESIANMPPRQIKDVQ